MPKIVFPIIIVLVCQMSSLLAQLSPDSVQYLEAVIQAPKSRTKGTQHSVFDSLPRLRNSSDSIAIKYENGRMVTPRLMDNTQINSNLNLNAFSSVTAIADSLPIESPALEEMLPDTIFDHESRINGLTGSVQDSIGLLTSEIRTLNRKLDAVSRPRAILSEQMIDKLYDSLGISKVDTLLALAKNYKNVEKSELLSLIRSSVGEDSRVSNLETLGTEVKQLSTRVNQLPGVDLSQIRLGTTDLVSLAPLKGYSISSFNAQLQDSLRKWKLKGEKLRLKEREYSKKIKEVIAIERPNFWDKSYLEMLLSYLSNRNAAVVQITPSFGYSLTKDLSIGAGLNIGLSQTSKKYSTSLGYRMFVKYALLDQRVYFQFEDNLGEVRIQNEQLTNGEHSLLLGGGGLVPILGRIKLNAALLYRVNNDQFLNGETSPFVFRIGLSTSSHFSKRSRL